MKRIILIITYMYIINFLYSQELKLNYNNNYYYNTQLKSILNENSLKKSYDIKQSNEKIKKSLDLKISNIDIIDYYKYIFGKNKILMRTYDYYKYYYGYYEDGINLIQNYKKNFLILRDLDLNIEWIKKGKINYTVTYRFKIYFDLEKIIKGELIW